VPMDIDKKKSSSAKPMDIDKVHIKHELIPLLSEIHVDHTRALTSSTRVTFLIGVVRCKVYEFLEGYRITSLFLESAKIRRLDFI